MNLFKISLFGLIALIFPILSQRHLIADGSYHLLMILENNGILTWDVPRQFAHILLHGPTDIAINIFNLESTKTLSFIYGSSLFFLPYIFILISSFIGRKVSFSFSLLPLISYFYLNLNTSLFIISEAHLGLGLFFISLSTILRLQKSYSHPIFLISFISIFILAKCYEECLVYLSFIGILLASELFKNKTQLNKGQFIGHAILLAQTILSFTITLKGLYWSISTNWWRKSVSPLVDILNAFQSIQLILSSLIICVTIFLLCFRNRLFHIKINLPIKYLTIGIILGIPFIMFYLDSFILSAHRHMDSRHLISIFPVVLCLFFLKFQDSFKKYKKVLLSVTIIFLYWNISWNIYATVKWSHYKERFEQILEVNDSLIPINKTNLYPSPFYWRHFSPSLSLILKSINKSKSPGLIINFEGKWQPFDPLKKGEYPKFIRDY